MFKHLNTYSLKLLFSDKTFRNRIWLLVIEPLKNKWANLNGFDTASSRRYHYRTLNQEKNGNTSSIGNIENLHITDNVKNINPSSYYTWIKPNYIQESTIFRKIIEPYISQKEFDLIYSDEDFLINKKYQNYYLKPEWSPHTLLAHNYIGTSFIVKTSLLLTNDSEEIHPHLLLLRLSTLDNLKTKRIPKTLFHITNENVANIAKKKILQFLTAQGYSKSRFLNTHNDKFRTQIAIREEPKVSILIPAKNNARITDTCIQSIYDKTTYENFEVILIDNQSDEESFKTMYRKWSAAKASFKKIDFNEAFNFSKAMNLGAQMSTGDYLLLLNNDTEVITEGWIQLLLGYAQLKNAGAVGAKLLFKNNKIQHAGMVAGIIGVASHIYLRHDRDENGAHDCLQTVRNYSSVTGACLLVKKEKYLEVNGLEEELPLEYNDVDFCYKLLEKGYHNLVVPFAELYHYESYSRGFFTDKKNIESFKKDYNYMMKKWSSIIEKDPYYHPKLTNLKRDMSIS